MHCHGTCKNPKAEIDSKTMNKTQATCVLIMNLMIVQIDSLQEWICEQKPKENHSQFHETITKQIRETRRNSKI